MSEEVTAERLTKIYVRIRDKRRELEKQSEELKLQLDVVSAKLLEICKAQGVSTMRTPYGTVSKRITKNYWTNDWGSFMEFVKKHDALALLQHRINTTNMEQFLEAHPDLHPPGLNLDASNTIVITKR